MDNDTNNLSKAIDSLSEQKKKLDIALHYTHNDTEKAKNMTSGLYKDMYVIKAKFSASTTFGAAILFFNIPYLYLPHSLVLMSHSYEVNDLRTKIQWRIFEEELNKMIQSGNQDGEMTSKLRDELAIAFTVKMSAASRANELKKHLDSGDEISANRVIKKFIQDRFGFQNIDLNVDYEQISSLDMELYSTTSAKIEIGDKKDEKKEKTGEPKIESFTDEEDELEGKDIQLILKGELVLSPIKGKPVSTVKTGDRLRINLDPSNHKAVSIAKAFKSYNEDEKKILPITGRAVTVRHLMDGGYKIFCVIAKGIYVKIEEEEENIKIAFEGAEDILESGDLTGKLPVVIIVAIIFFILVAVIIALVLI